MLLDRALPFGTDRGWVGIRQWRRLNGGDEWSFGFGLNVKYRGSSLNSRRAWRKTPGVLVGYLHERDGIPALRDHFTLCM